MYVFTWMAKATIFWLAAQINCNSSQILRNLFLSQAYMAHHLSSVTFCQINQSHTVQIALRDVIHNKGLISAVALLFIGFIKTAANLKPEVLLSFLACVSKRYKITVYFYELIRFIRGCFHTTSAPEGEGSGFG